MSGPDLSKNLDTWTSAVPEVGILFGGKALTLREGTLVWEGRDAEEGFFLIFPCNRQCKHLPLRPLDTLYQMYIIYLFMVEFDWLFENHGEVLSHAPK